ncbi:MAG TPA: hypothetical protein VE445_10115 [Nitrososphaeraceae archaeon]|nr:hypothetical protein [Nitrososphaeraceae archaeon]
MNFGKIRILTDINTIITITIMTVFYEIPAIVGWTNLTIASQVQHLVLSRTLGNNI